MDTPPAAFCPACGAALDADSRFCPGCGHDLTGAAGPAPDSTTTSTPVSASGLASAPFTPGRRAQILEQCFNTEKELNETNRRVPGGAESEQARLLERARLYTRELMALHKEYRDGVPRLPMSRCPFTETVMVHSIDNLGLDGLWWSYEAAIRPFEQLPPTYFALAGAVRLTGEVPRSPFLCKPGPEVPFVVPRILEHPAILAVLSAVAVNGQQGYAVAYFANPAPTDLPRINAWGTNDYQFYNAAGRYVWDVRPDMPHEYDFDLAPWIDSGKLRWIAPGDDLLALRTSPDGCPYLGLEGARDIQRIQNGNVWS